MKSFPAFGILLRSRGQIEEVRALLETNSGLPGPRANLELAYSFAASVAGMRLESWHWDFLLEMAATSPTNAPKNTPKEFLPVCALMALGALHGGGLPRAQRRSTLAAIKAGASDARWRVREGAAMALQLIGEKDLDALRAIVTDWLPEATLLEKRAIAAGLAHPPILADADFAQFCLETARSIVASVSRVDERGRRDEAFKVLRQGLGYALSVFVAHCPGEGFALLRRSAAVRDPDIAWIIRENLKKKRISEKYPKEVQQVALILEEANAR